MISSILVLCQHESARLAECPRVPKVLIVREGGLEDGGASVEARPSPKKTVVEFLSGASADVAALEPGAKLDQLVDLLVLANQDAAESLRESLGPSASVVRPEDEDGETPKIDLLLAAHSPSIQVFDIERELARLEELLRSAIPAERRPAKSGTWSFGKDLTGESLGGKYRIKRLKGKGAFKTVYEGEDEMLGARVAVAVLNPKGARSPRALEHFQDEAKKLTTLDHENIVRWITFDRTQDGLNYFVMEYLDGEELEELLRREGRLAPKRVARILWQVVAALKRAHKAGKQGSLLHLDLKPENVFVLPALAPGEPERVKVIDFGIGQHVGAEILAAERPELRSLYDLPAEELGKSIGSIALPEDDGVGDDQAGDREREHGLDAGPDAASAPDTHTPVRRRVQRARGGTLLYASPEQCKHLAGHKDIVALDGRSDLYSLGVMAFRMLTGQFPFARITTAHEAIQNHLEVAPRKVGSLGIKIPRTLAAFVDRCLVKEREKRWRDAGEAFEALERIVHPRLSPVKVAVPLAGVVAVGIGALYFTRSAVVNPLTLVDPEIQSVSARVVNELPLGRKKASRVLRLESDSAWDPESPPELELLDWTNGKPVAGWRASWVAGSPQSIEIACLPEAVSAPAKIELDGGRGGRWESGRIALDHLGPWKIESVAVVGYATTKELDPRGRTLELEVGGDPEGRAALQSIEVFDGETRIFQSPAGTATARGARAVYEGPALETLFTKVPHVVELRVVAKDRAGQEEELPVSFRIAGEPARFVSEGTGFVGKAELESALLPYGQVQAVLPEFGLRIEVTARATARVFLEPSDQPALERDLAGPGAPLVLPLRDLGIAGTSDRPGRLRIEIDDSPWVYRATEAKETRLFPFYYTPRPPEIQALLVAPDFEKKLLEDLDDETTNVINAGEHVRLAVSPPPGTHLWLEASCRRDYPGVSADPVRMAHPGSGPFELPFALPSEGSYRIAVQQYVLATGDQKGPLIPPEHVFSIEVDRTAPVVELALEGAQGADSGGSPLFKGAFSQRIFASVTEKVGLGGLSWSLTRPDGSRQGDKLASWPRVELPPLDALQSADGRYELECVALDSAGNRGSKSVTWQVARGGPELELQEPVAAGSDQRWTLGDGRKWNVRVRAIDPNGVAGVRARVVYQKQPGPELTLVPAVGDLWELPEADRQTALPWWSGKELVLELVARDGAGLEGAKTVRGLVPEIPHAGALVIAPRARPGEVPADVPTEVMVEVPTGGDYVFGGKSGEGRRPWNVPIARGALRPYFLDAREVSRGEFLAFVESAGGFADPRWWPAGDAPDAARAAELARRLSAEPLQAATGIAWAEAHAYAAWRGKRLPTLLEWEFAVRGPEYREAPADARPAGAPAGWPSNLCGGVREWTATPEDLVAEALDFASQCLRHPERLLAPVPGTPEVALASAPQDTLAPRSVSHWAVGANAGQTPGWSARTLERDSVGGEDVGFRCAIDQESAHSWLDRGNYVVFE